jgi:hypothetical protein
MAMIVIAGFITFLSFWIVLHFMPPRLVRRIMGTRPWLDLVLHGGVIVLFLGAPTMLIQAELSAIMFSLAITIYRKLFGYEKLQRSGLKLRWMRYAGVMHK